MTKCHTDSAVCDASNVRSPGLKAPLATSDILLVDLTPVPDEMTPSREPAHEATPIADEPILQHSPRPDYDCGAKNGGDAGNDSISEAAVEAKSPQKKKKKSKRHGLEASNAHLDVIRDLHLDLEASPRKMKKKSKKPDAPH
ncbi:hypothetical protein EV174_003461 [Coemansia sp. RSA 2320]|nr:hypothetical protein EV174_003461 [Coemansia sp. RSA 2320]